MTLDHHQIITRQKKKYGDELAILAHHYQSDDIVAQADFVGDSLELARNIPDLKARYIVFCGVRFMGETAAILQQKHQRVYLPETEASCALADMATADDVRRALDYLSGDGRTVLPVAYVNSSVAVKAVVGESGGTVCTSANARTIMAWALNHGDAALFLPDRNLARNTAKAMGLSKDQVAGVSLPDPEPVPGALVYAWPGYCPIHEEYDATWVEAARAEHPGAMIAVHPECPPSVVDAADAAGSTSFLIDYVEKAPRGSTLLIGTETNLVLRLARRHRGRVTVLPLGQPAYCADMGMVTPEKLAFVLERLEETEPVSVDRDLAEPARLALTRMLEASR